LSRASGAERAKALRHLETEMDNIVGALEWSLAEPNGDASVERSATALRIAGSMAWTWWVLGRVGDGRAWIDRALRAGPKTASQERARCLHAVGILADLAGDLEWPARCVGEAIESFREMGDRPKTASALNSLAIITRSRGDLVGARALLESSLVLREELGDQRGVAMCLSNLGVFALDGGDLIAAESLLERARALNRRLDDTHAEASDAANLGAVFLEGGDAARAAQLLGPALGVIHESGDLEGVAETLGRLAAAFACLGELRRAARLFGASDALMREVGVGTANFERARIDRYRVLVQDTLGGEEFTRAIAEGEAMEAESAVAFALATDEEKVGVAPGTS
jgi:tetratricopeptide (TPR) repeat protein